MIAIALGYAIEGILVLSIMDGGGGIFSKIANTNLSTTEHEEREGIHAPVRIIIQWN